jgi:hypothetical protein
MHSLTVGFVSRILSYGVVYFLSSREGVYFCNTLKLCSSSSSVAVAGQHYLAALPASWGYNRVQTFYLYHIWKHWIQGEERSRKQAQQAVDHSALSPHILYLALTLCYTRQNVNGQQGSVIMPTIILSTTQSSECSLVPKHITAIADWILFR